MVSAVSIHHPTFTPQAFFENNPKSPSKKALTLGFPRGQFLHGRIPCWRRLVIAGAVGSDAEPGDSEREDRDASQKKSDEAKKNRSSRDALERLIGEDDSKFSGFDLAMLIRKKYGRSYDVQLIKKEFMGRNLLAMNVMWKYREQRSFPLTEEEYLLRLDDVANMLKCWGAVSHVRSSLERLKERPRIGKAVSIFIDMDETGGRSNEWIYK